MSDERNVLPFAKPSSTPSATSKPGQKPAGAKEATKAAEKILSCYPDYDKATPEYIVNLIDCMATFPTTTLAKLCDLRTGIPARCPYLPTLADVVQIGNEFERATSNGPVKLVRVFVGTPAWDAWAQRPGPNGRIGDWPRYPLKLDDGTTAQGWYFPTEFPE